VHLEHWLNQLVERFDAAVCDKRVNQLPLHGRHRLVHQLRQLVIARLLARDLRDRKLLEELNRHDSKHRARTKAVIHLRWRFHFVGQHINLFGRGCDTQSQIVC